MAADPQIEGYSDVVEVARGGFGVVYRAHQDRFDRVVALKVLTVENLDDHDRERSERECRAMGNLSWHPHVVAVHDSGITASGHPYLAMEFLDAGSLADQLSDGPLAWPDAVSAGIQVAGALGAAHAAGTLHRDLKPENILIGPFGESKLGDFGIAAVEGGARTATGHASYTITHVAPEVLRGQRPDARSDVYGLASTIHTLLTGAPPFAGDRDEAVAAVITRVLQAPAPRLEGVPDDLADLLQRSLAKEPDDRPQSAKELGEALQAVQAANGEPVTDLRLARTASGPTSRTGAGTGAAAVAPTATPGGSEPTVHHGPGESTGEDPNATIHVAPAAAPTPAPAPAPAPPDEAATPPPPTPSAPDSPPSPDAASPKRGKLVGAIVGVVALLALAGGAAAVLSGGDEPDDPGPSPTTSPNTTLIDTANTVIETVTLTGPNPTAVSATSDAVWVATDSTSAGVGSLDRIDPATNQLTNNTDTRPMSGLAVNGDATWAASPTGTGTLLRIDLATDAVDETIDITLGANSVAATDDAVWVTATGVNDNGVVAPVDPSTNVRGELIAVGHNPTAVAATNDAVWVTNGDDGTASRIDPG